MLQSGARGRNLSNTKASETQHRESPGKRAVLFFRTGKKKRRTDR